MWQAHAREILLSIHLLAIVIWIGFGFYELWLGRLYLASTETPTEAPLIRFIYKSDLVVFIATLIAFATGTAMALLFGWGFFQSFWLGATQAIMFAVLFVIAGILRPALRLGRLIDTLPAGPGAAIPEIRAIDRRLEPWYLAMRLAAIAAVLLAVWRPA